MSLSRRVLQSEHGHQKTEKERESGGCQDQGSTKLDMRQANVESRALDGEGYAH